MNRSIHVVLCCVGLVLGVASTVRGQDIDILASLSGGQVQVAEYNRDAAAVRQTRAFGGRFDGFYVDNNPGFTSLAGGGGLPSGAELAWDFMPITHNGVTSTLLYWDGQGGTPDFGLTPTGEYELTLFGRDNQPAVADGGSEIVPGETIDFANSSGGIHAHQFFFLDDNGDGSSSTPPDAGFYLIAMRLLVEGFERSDPFYLAWGTPDSSAVTQSQMVLPWIEERADSLILPGDHNFDGRVDAADYTVWRDGSGVTHSAADYTDWLSGYGAVAEGFGGAPGSVVPEPAASVATLLGLSLIGFDLRRSRAAK